MAEQQGVRDGYNFELVPSTFWNGRVGDMGGGSEIQFRLQDGNESFQMSYKLLNTEML